MSKETLKQILNLLEKEKINYKHDHHEAIPGSSHEAAKARGTKVEQGAKAIILQAKSGKFLQVIIQGHKRIDLKKLKALIEEKNVSLADPKHVHELTDCVIGTVPPIGILWHIPVYLDEQVLSLNEVVFSAGTHEDSMKLNPEDLAKINKAKIADIAKD